MASFSSKSPTPSITLVGGGAFSLAPPAPTCIMVGVTGAFAFVPAAPTVNMEGQGGSFAFGPAVPTISLSGSDVGWGVFSFSAPTPSISIAGQSAAVFAFHAPAPSITLYGDVLYEGSFALSALAPAILLRGGGDPSLAFSVWVLNPESGHATYDSFPFTSLARFGGKCYGTRDGGIYLLEGDTDGGSIIESTVMFGTNDYGRAHSVKRLRAVNIKGRDRGGNVRFVAVADEKRKETHTVDFSGAEGVQSVRVPTTREIFGQNIQVGFENIAGGDFEIHEMEVVSMMLERRW